MCWGKLIIISYFSLTIPGILIKKTNYGSEERGRTEKKIFFLSISRLVYMCIVFIFLKQPLFWIKIIFHFKNVEISTIVSNFSGIVVQ